MLCSNYHLHGAKTNIFFPITKNDNTTHVKSKLSSAKNLFFFADLNWFNYKPWRCDVEVSRACQYIVASFSGEVTDAALLSSHGRSIQIKEALQHTKKIPVTY